MFLKDVFYDQNIKGELGVLPNSASEWASQEAAQFGLAPEP